MKRYEAFQVPFKIGLLDSSGKDLRFSAQDSDIADIDDNNGYSVVLDLNKQEQEFVLSNVIEKPFRLCSEGSQHL